jgi:hypothetical protein
MLYVVIAKGDGFGNTIVDAFDYRSGEWKGWVDDNEGEEMLDVKSTLSKCGAKFKFRGLLRKYELERKPFPPSIE